MGAQVNLTSRWQDQCGLRPGSTGRLRTSCRRTLQEPDVYDQLDLLVLSARALCMGVAALPGRLQEPADRQQYQRSRQYDGQLRLLTRNGGIRRGSPVTSVTAPDVGKLVAWQHAEF